LAEIGHEAVLPREADAGAPVDVVMFACSKSRSVARPAVGVRWASLPLVCIGDEPVAAERRCRQAAAYLVRPYSLETLSGALRRALGG
jgi:hypothetical protein